MDQIGREPDVLSAQGLRDALGFGDHGLDVRVFDTLDSTNRYAKELAKNGEATHALICASSQTAGRGRMGKSFYSPDGSGVYFSILCPFELSSACATSVTSAAAVAVMRAIRALTGKQTEIKWVNDLYLDGKKVCGFLAETLLMGRSGFLVLGIGINWYAAPFPTELSEIAGSVGAVGVARSTLIARIYRELTPYLSDPSNRAWLEEYRAHSAVIGKDIVWTENGVSRKGRAVGIDDLGGLCVQTEDGESCTLQSGEISVRLV